MNSPERDRYLKKVKEERQAYIIAAVICPILIVLLYFAVNWTQEFKCNNRWSGAYPSRYDVFAGCKVNVDGRWMPEDNVRAVN